jgi:hypothetical protein
VSIGFLGAGAADTSAHLIEAIKQGLRENGLVEGKDYVLDPRWADGHYERFPAFALELADQSYNHGHYDRGSPRSAARHLRYPGSHGEHERPGS